MASVGLLDTVDVACVENPTGVVTEPMNKSPFACGSAMAPKAHRAMEAISTITGDLLFLQTQNSKVNQLYFPARSPLSKFAMRSTAN